MTIHVVAVAGYETIHAFEGEAAAQEFAAWAYRVGYSPITERVERITNHGRRNCETQRRH